MRAQKVSCQVDINNFPPPGLIRFEEMQHRPDETGVIHQDLGMTERSLSGREHGIDIFAIGNVPRCGKC